MATVYRTRSGRGFPSGDRSRTPGGSGHSFVFMPFGAADPGLQDGRRYTAEEQQLFGRHDALKFLPDSILAN
jgi:hypothetical protein